MGHSASAPAIAGGNVVELYRMDPWGSIEPGSGFRPPRTRQPMVSRESPEVIPVSELDRVRFLLRTAELECTYLNMGALNQFVTLRMRFFVDDLAFWVRFWREDVIMLERGLGDKVWTREVMGFHLVQGTKQVVLRVGARRHLPDELQDAIRFSCGGGEVSFPKQGTFFFITKGRTTTQSPTFSL